MHTDVRVQSVNLSAQKLGVLGEVFWDKVENLTVSAKNTDLKPNSPTAVSSFQGFG